MSIAAIRNGIYTTLTASGPYTIEEISACSFDPLERAAACAVTYFPEGTSPIEALEYGNPRNYMRRWRIGGTLWIRVLDDPKAVLGRIWQGYDDLYNTFSKDDTLASSACAAQLVSITHDSNRFWDAGGHLWKPVDWVLEAQEF